MKQECPLVNVWLTWITAPAIAILGLIVAGWLVGALLLVFGFGAQLLYVRFVPRLSKMLGYGGVDEAATALSPASTAKRVILYTASVCPYCPTVRQRLAALREKLGFDLQEVDITFRPELVRAKGLKSVPVIEADGRFLVGNATSEQLAAFLSAAPAERASV